MAKVLAMTHMEHYQGQNGMMSVLDKQIVSPSALECVILTCWKSHQNIDIILKKGKGTQIT
jgi:hypothetical protein